MTGQAEELCIRRRDPLAVVASVKETMLALKIGRAKTYELLNSGELESYLEGSSRKVTWGSIDAYVKRRLEQEAERRNRGGRNAIF
ncbi:DNA-binding protein [Bradyrhizobium sp. 15]|uniref:DNA-binding protein n=1 Tax=Bradyrhizobium sp. 15 TaxID=2782633 RepID=UPI001FF854F8|nr:DNA-binding protein [Bradyrhizobium sp. 15]MCK1437069.1 DNA-binding protein [Bradyrhizobium sp. 15]